MSEIIIFDVDVHDPKRFADFTSGTAAVVKAYGGRFLARGGDFTVYEGDWQPRRVVILEFPSKEAFEAMYNGPEYQPLKAIRDECSTARLVGVQGAA